MANMSKLSIFFGDIVFPAKKGAFDTGQVF